LAGEKVSKIVGFEKEELQVLEDAFRDEKEILVSRSEKYVERESTLRLSESEAGYPPRGAHSRGVRRKSVRSIGGFISRAQNQSEMQLHLEASTLINAPHDGVRTPLSDPRPIAKGADRRGRGEMLVGSSLEAKTMQRGAGVSARMPMEKMSSNTGSPYQAKGFSSESLGAVEGAPS